MRTAFMAAAAALAFAAPAAQATDVLNSDPTVYNLVVTHATETFGVQVPRAGDIRDICDGCRITMDDDQFVDAGKNDIVMIVDGKIYVHVP